MEIHAFTPQWWNNFIKKTNSLKSTSVFKNCMKAQETSEMRNFVFEILKIIIKNKSLGYGFRLFIEKKQFVGKELNDFLEVAIPKKNENFEEWSIRCFQDKKYGIIINRGEKFSPVMAEKIAKKIAPLTRKLGIPRVGMTFTIFIGNYGWTPIGIHTDGIGENVMHFHLGKGGKTMYTWDNEIYKNNVKKNKRFNNKEVEPILHLANEYPFYEGDIYFMPNGKYHIGKTDDLSIGLTLWFNNHTREMLLNKIFDAFYQEHFVNDGDILNMDMSSSEDIENFKDIELMFKDIESLKNFSFYELFKMTYKDYKMALFSNCGFWEPPFPKAEVLDHSKNYDLQIIHPFKILYSTTGQKLNLFIRGSKININNDTSVVELIKKLNEGQAVNKNEAHKILNPEWDKDVKNYLLKTLFSHHILKVKYL